MAQAKSMREALEESFTSAEKGDEGDVEETELEDDVGGEKRSSEDSTPEETPKGETGPEDEESVSAEEEAPESADSSELDPEEEEEGSGEPALPVPASWRPATRELWAKLPVDVQEEVTKREREISQGLQQASGHKKVAQEYLSVIKPYEALIRSQNSTPVESIDGLMQTAARLTMGTPAQKAQVVSEIISNYAVDIATLDSVLSGQVVPGGEHGDLLHQLDERLKPMNEFMGRFNETEQMQTSEATQKIADQIETFSSNPKNEFYEDVREDMADRMELAARRGRDLTLKQAYDAACKEHPDISKILTQRKSARVNRLTPESRDRKRHAASGVASRPPSGVNSDKADTSIRGSLLSALEEQEEGTV